MLLFHNGLIRITFHVSDTIQGQYLARLKWYCHSLPAILSAHATPNQLSTPADHSQHLGPVFKPQPLVHCQIVPLHLARLSSTGFQFACLLLTSPVLDPARLVCLIPGKPHCLLSLATSFYPLPSGFLSACSWAAQLVDALPLLYIICVRSFVLWATSSLIPLPCML